MANAAAKKAVAARTSTANTYQPIFLGANVLYLLAKFVFSTRSEYTLWSYLGILILLGLNFLCYSSILEAASNNPTSSKNKTDLVGGVWLDVVALVWLVQAGTTLWSPRFYYLLLILPPWGAYRIYATMKGAVNPAGTNSGAPQKEEVSEEVLKRRQQRAEKRRQKRF